MSVLNTLAVSSDVQALVGGELNVYPGREGITTSYLRDPEGAHHQKRYKWNIFRAQRLDLRLLILPCWVDERLDDVPELEEGGRPAVHEHERESVGVGRFEVDVVQREILNVDSEVREPTRCRR